jgi:dihydrodipicolinate synthase/N-acetylneuraminate lyase
MKDKRYPKTILATACVPWTPSFGFDEVSFRKEVQGLIKRGIHNIYLFGTAGEGYAVNEKQFEDIVTVFADEMRSPDLFPMVGIISLSMRTMLDRIDKCRSLGIKDFQFSLPSWGALSDTELDTFVHGMCDPFPDCRFLHYNNPRTKRLLNINDYEALASRIPNLVGVKFSTSDLNTLLSITASSCPLRFFFTETGYGFASMIGEFGLLLSIATSRIEKAWKYLNSAIEAGTEVTLEMQKELTYMVSKLIEITGSPKIDGAYDKMFCKLLDPDFPIRLLPPYEYNTDESFEKYRDFLIKELPQWTEEETC